jgi:hypothetical protein
MYNIIDYIIGKLLGIEKLEPVPIRVEENKKRSKPGRKSRK